MKNLRKEGNNLFSNLENVRVSLHFHKIGANTKYSYLICHGKKYTFSGLCGNTAVSLESLCTNSN